jgi:dienelactone hydrolase
MKKQLILILLITLPFFKAMAQQIKTSKPEYRDGDVKLEGFLAYDSSLTGKRPVVIVVHEWTGINDQTVKRCEQLAKLGYLAFAADIYGKGIRPQNPGEAGKEAGKYKENRSLMRSRMKAALAQVKQHELAENDEVAVIGYCFGGTAALELARSGANVKGVVSFHGGLDNPKPEDAKNIKAKVLICHGAIDPFAPKEQVDAFVKEMNGAKADYQLILYSNAVHSFTNPGAGTDISKGAAYNAEADKRSWEAMKTFFEEIFD